MPDIRITVHCQLGDVFQGLGSAVKRLSDLEQFRVEVNKIDRRFASIEGWVIQNIFQETDVGFHATDAELAQGPLTALDSALQRAPLGSHFHQ